MSKQDTQDTRGEIVDAWSRIEGDEYPLHAPLPETLMIETTNACNLACSMCMNPKMQRKLGRISLQTLDLILDQAGSAGIQRIALYTTGEPLMHKKIFELIDRVKSAGFYTYITTNALLLDDESIERLLTCGLDSIKYSVDGLNKQEYEAIRIKGDYEQLMGILVRVKQRRDALGVRVKLLLGIILAEYNYQDKQKYLEHYGPYVDEIIFSLISNQTGHIGPEEFALIRPSGLKVSTDWRPCRQLWDRLVVTYDGKLVACCIDFEAELQYADLREQALEQAWNSAAMQALRRAHLSGRLKDYPLCQGCDSPYIQQSEVFKLLND